MKYIKTEEIDRLSIRRYYRKHKRQALVDVGAMAEIYETRDYLYVVAGTVTLRFFDDEFQHQVWLR